MTNKDNQNKISHNNNNEEVEKLTLDTHILLWYVEGMNLSESQVRIIESARVKGNLYISTISIWEIALLCSKGKIVLSIPLNEWISKLLAIPGLNLIELSPTILVESCSLPNFEHKDPADRFIISTVRSINSHLMSFDQKIIDYANSGYLKILSNNNQNS